MRQRETPFSQNAYRLLYKLGVKWTQTKRGTDTRGFKHWWFPDRNISLYLRDAKVTQPVFSHRCKYSAIVKGNTKVFGEGNMGISCNACCTKCVQSWRFHFVQWLKIQRMTFQHKWR